MQDQLCGSKPFTVCLTMNRYIQNYCYKLRQVLSANVTYCDRVFVLEEGHLCTS